MFALWLSLLILRAKKEHRFEFYGIPSILNSIGNGNVDVLRRFNDEKKNKITRLKVIKMSSEQFFLDSVDTTILPSCQIPFRIKTSV